MQQNGSKKIVHFANAIFNPHITYSCFKSDQNAFQSNKTKKILLLLIEIIEGVQRCYMRITRDPFSSPTADRTDGVSRMYKIFLKISMTTSEDY